MHRLARHFKVVDPDTGEILHESVNYGSQNGDKWVIVYRETYMDLTLTVPDLTTLKVFNSLMTKQEFEGGIKTTKKAIADEINVSYRSIMTAFKWLKENHYVKERKNRGQTEFLLNPNVTTCGKNKEDKIRLWQECEEPNKEKK